MRNMWRIVRIALPAAIVLLLVGFAAWLTAANPIMPEASDALQSSDTVQVSSGRWIVFEPADAPARTGLILYPGVRVDPRAYAPSMRALTEEGYLAVIVPMPLNLALLGVNRADDVLAAYPDIEVWVMAGHSLGGSMAAQYAGRHADTINGLVMMGAFATEGSGLAETQMPVLTFSGSQDDLLPPERIETYRSHLPADAQFVLIEGGNHAQFGYYGLQPGDGVATISRSEQQAQVVENVLAFMHALTDN